ncbi:MAG: YlxR family protein [Firmicutes bacterium]|nr:YlxR family protein [Bacillota bacterium]
MTEKNHYPERMCIACRKRFPQDRLIRIVKTGDGLMPYEKGLSGRSCYLCGSEECMSAAFKKNLFARSFRSEVPRAQLQELARKMNMNI